MAPATNTMKIVDAFITQLKQHNIHISQAYLFGSRARNIGNESSDIELAIASESFVGFLIIQITRIQFFDAIRTKSVTKLGFRMAGNIFFQLIPIAFIIANFFT